MFRHDHEELPNADLSVIRGRLMELQFKNMVYLNFKFY
jgi:hypothetical protein